MIGSGRCHGPGCRNTARTEFWCSEACAGAWSRQYVGVAPLASESLANIEIRFPSAAVRRLSVALPTTLSAEVDPDSPTPPLPAAEGTFAERVFQDEVRAATVLDEPAPRPAQLTLAEVLQGPQVASNDPQVGYLARAFHWLFGRTS